MGPTASAPVVSAPAAAPTTYTVQPGDTSNSIAAKLGYSNYKTAGLSGFKSGNPDLITPGEVLTVGGTPSVNQLINTSTQSRTQTAQASSDLAAALAKISGTPTVSNQNPTTPISTPNTPDTGGGDSTIDTNTVLPANDPIISGLNTLSANSDAATKSLIAATQASYQTQRNAVTSQYENYKRGLQQLGVESGAAQATPDLLAGHILQAGNDELTKINDLNAKEAKALMDANNAKATNDFKTLQDKMAYVKQVQTEKAAAIKNMYDTINNTNKALAADTHYDLYNAFQTLTSSDDKNTFINTVAQKYNISPLAVVQALQDEQDKRTTANLKTTNSQSIINKRNAGGGSTGISKKNLTANIDSIFSNDTKDANGYSVLGSDNFVDPQAYLAAFQKWTSEGFGAKQFATQYPYKDYINPASYGLLPNILKPASKSSSSQGS